MATGLIGQVTLIGSNSSVSQTSSTLSYTCPASGVKYAVLTINESLSITISSNVSDIKSPSLSLKGGSNTPTASTVTNTYSIVLGPSQTWSGNLSMPNISGQTGATSDKAFMVASVIEVV